jgi:hypothetical protein
MQGITPSYDLAALSRRPCTGNAAAGDRLVSGTRRWWGLRRKPPMTSRRAHGVGAVTLKFARKGWKTAGRLSEPALGRTAAE